MKKEYVDKNGYKRGKVKHSELIHRQIAYKEIYLKRKEEFPKPFSFYQIHHIDHNKQNNDVSNLMLLSKEDHEKIHQIYPDDPIKELKNKHGLSNWEIKKLQSNISGNFSLIRLLIGHKATDIIFLTTKWSLFISIGVFIISVFIYGLISKNVLPILSIIIFIPISIFILSIVVTLLLGTIGWIYNHIGNLVDDTKKRLRK